MLRRAILALAFAAGALALSPAAAQAIPPGDTLTVIAYFSGPDRQTLVGQKWHGCKQPSGSWGTTSPYVTLFFPPC
ncbi:MAG TPA: DUF6289 family protein [Pilimelia sp.]|nr:DUF6289 family protein [Pilimelia sp.]